MAAPGQVSAATCHLTQSGERERGTDEAGAHNAGMGTGSARRDDVSGANIATAEILACTAMGRSPAANPALATPPPTWPTPPPLAVAPPVPTLTAAGTDARRQ
ncbi:hypothetical protein ACQKB4_16775 [Mycobacterium tuberculosis]